jgi:hypothetical protein
MDMPIIGDTESPIRGGYMDCLQSSADRLWLFVNSLNRRRFALVGTGLVIFLLLCARADANDQDSRAGAANKKAPSTSEEPKFLIFWSEPEKARNLPSEPG